MTGQNTPWIRSLQRRAQKWGVDVITATDPRYENARLIFNRFHNMRPGALIRAGNPSVVGEVIRFAAEEDITLCVRGGGHHIAGFGTCEGGLVLDFSPYRSIEIHQAGIVEVQPGARLADVDHALSKHQLVVPTGTVSETGIAGLALGGGIGWLVGKYGLTCDHLIGADVVLANGHLVKAEAPDHEDLLWALRGGGGNFGVVTRFRFQAQPLLPITAGTAEVAFTNGARQVLSDLVMFLSDGCPAELTVAPLLTHSPDGSPLLSIDFCIAGSDEAVLRVLKAAVGRARWSIHRGIEYTSWQKYYDRFSQPMRAYWKAYYTEQLVENDLDLVFEAYSRAPNNHPYRRTTILVEHLHGAFADGTTETSAFPLRTARYGVLFSSRWVDPSDDPECISWVRGAFARLDPLGRTATYSNYTPHDDSRAVDCIHGLPLQRLISTKFKYDPFNQFRRNHNFADVPASMLRKRTGQKPNEEAR